MIQIRKKGFVNFFHYWDGITPTAQYGASDLVITFDGNIMYLRATNGRVIFLKDGFDYSDVEVFDDTTSQSWTSFASVIELQQKLIDLGHPAYAQEGVVILPENLDDLGDVTISSPTIGQALVYQGSGVWANQSTSGSSLFLGTYTSLANLTIAHPDPEDGSYAFIDEGIGEDVRIAIWDNNDDEWILGGVATFGVESVTGDSVDNTDPLNPVVNNYKVNVLDYIATAQKTKVINRDDTQDSTIVTSGFQDAIDYCLANEIKQLTVNDGLYILDKVNFDSLIDFRIVGEGATLLYNSGNSVLEFIDCENIYITGLFFDSEVAAYSDVAFIRATTGNAYFNIENNTFKNFPRCGILASSFSGGTYTKGLTITKNNFIDTPNYNNVNQCGIELGTNAEYSKIVNNNFHTIPSAIRFTDGANSIFAFNDCKQINGNINSGLYDRAVIYQNYSSNSGKLDIINNKINHNETGVVCIIIKGDPTKPQNACKIIGNDILANGVSTQSISIYIKDAPSTIINDNKIRGFVTTPNSNGLIIEASDSVSVSNNYFKYFNNAVQLIDSQA